MRSLSPLIFFALVYFVASLCLADFYAMPLSVAFIAALAYAVVFTLRGTLSERLDALTHGGISSGVVSMLLIFILAGAFSSLTGHIGSVSAVVSLFTAMLPARFLLPGLFLAACMVSFAVGTSVGTVAALVPIAIRLSATSPVEIAFPVCIAAVVSGAFFGDNLSFISDTTVAVSRTVGCRMADKFRANLPLALPAALCTVAAYAFLGHTLSFAPTSDADISWLHAMGLSLPYFVVIGAALFGLDVLFVLFLGLLTALGIGLISSFSFAELSAAMGSGIVAMGDLVIATLLASVLLSVVASTGGISWLIAHIERAARSRRRAEGSLVGLTFLTDLATANNTIALLTVGPVGARLADAFGLSRPRVASLMDTTSCIAQSLIPYGAQLLLAAALAHTSCVGLYPYLIYPYALAAAVVASLFVPRRFRLSAFR